MGPRSRFGSWPCGRALAQQLLHKGLGSSMDDAPTDDPLVRLRSMVSAKVWLVPGLTGAGGPCFVPFVLTLTILRVPHPLRLKLAPVLREIR